MSAHTLGPWRVTAPDEISVGSNDGRIAILTNLRGALGMSGRRNPDEVMANARLVAAAPDLLEALQRYVAQDLAEDSHYSTGQYAGMPKRKTNLHRTAVAAIAKATGVQP